MLRQRLPDLNPVPAASLFSLSFSLRNRTLMKLIVKSLIFISLLFTQLSCDKTTSFSPIGKVTRIEVIGSTSSPLKIIKDKNQISRISAFIDKNATDWGGFADWAGVPVPDIVINLYDGENFKGHFGVGSNFFETQRSGDFTSKSASKSERGEFLRLIGISRHLADD